MVEWVSTLTVSLPSSSADTPRRPCEAITIRSQPLRVRGVDDGPIGLVVHLAHGVARHARRGGGRLDVLQRLSETRRDSSSYSSSPTDTSTASIEATR